MPASDFQLEVFFSGLVFYVTDERKSDGSISKVTHVVLRDGRKDKHDYHLGFSSEEEHDDYSGIVRSDLEHTARVAVVKNGKVEEKELEKHWVYFEWRKGNDPVSHGSGAAPCGDPRDLEDHLPEKKSTRCSFYWVPFIGELGPKNPVVKKCYDNSVEKPAVVGCIPLAGGNLETSVFAWVHQFKPKDETSNQVEKQRWISRLKFCPEQGMPTRVDRAAAEGVTWIVEPPDGATKLYIYRASFEQPDDREMLWDFDVEPGKKALVGVTNYPTERKMGENEIHPGRAHDYGSMHFEMFYDLLLAPVPPGIRHIPWTPGACKETPEFLKNAIPYYRIGACPVDVGKKKKPSEYKTAAEAFAKDDRPLCVGSGGSGG